MVRWVRRRRTGAERPVSRVRPARRRDPEVRNLSWRLGAPRRRKPHLTQLRTCFRRRNNDQYEVRIRICHPTLRMSGLARGLRFASARSPGDHVILVVNERRAQADDAQSLARATESGSRTRHSGWEGQWPACSPWPPWLPPVSVSWSSCECPAVMRSPRSTRAKATRPAPVPPRRGDGTGDRATATRAVSGSSMTGCRR